MDELTYGAAGVDIAAGNEAVRRIKALAARTARPGADGGIGGFAGAFCLPEGQTLVAGADGVGTKLKVAFALGRHDTVGIDCVAMNVNDLLCTGAEPLFFLDYLAVGKLDPAQIETVVGGVVEGCTQAGCVLLGGETAEMPDFYAAGEYDLAGFAVGLLPPGRMPLDGSRVQPGDAVVGLASTGVHSNGFSLVRRIVAQAGVDWNHVPEGWRQSLGETLLEPTRIYVKPVLAALKRFDVRGMSHITGGGLVENPPRMLPSGLGLELRAGSWPEPEVFGWLRRQGHVPETEMRRTFNLGLGFLMIVPTDQAEALCADLAMRGVAAWRVGTVVPQADGPQVVFAS